MAQHTQQYKTKGQYKKEAYEMQQQIGSDAQFIKAVIYTKEKLENEVIKLKKQVEENRDIEIDVKYLNENDKNNAKLFNKVKQLEMLEKELGVDLLLFLTECKNVLKQNGQVLGITSNGVNVVADYNEVKDFIRQIKIAVELWESEKCSKIY